MSGFVGIFHRDGCPVDGAQLEALTASLRFRGPDGLCTWRRGNVGLGHARFTTEAARDGEPQPLGLDGRFWIAGHIRLDAREELIATLCHSERSEESCRASDAALVLRAYRAWGADCLQRIHGDFSFAIWDEPQRRLFCARDPFGVRPLFYADLGPLFIVGNTLESLREHPRVGSRLDELAVADFLLFGFQQDADATIHAGIRRLPPAHFLVVRADGSRIARYWTLPSEPYARCTRPEDYVAGFNEVLTRAVADRVGDAPVTLQLSGGLDSGAIAAALAGKLGQWRPTAPVRCVCHGYNKFFPDAEPALARDSAQALGLELEVWEEDSRTPFEAWDSGDVGPEPSLGLFRKSSTRALHRMKKFSPVLLNGQGGDEVLACDPLLDEFLRSRDAALFADAVRSWRMFRRPALGLRGLSARRQRQKHRHHMPAWLASAWVGRADLRERLQSANEASRQHGRGTRSAARRLAQPMWLPYLESWDPGLSGVCVEARFPYLDHRVVRWFLSLPPYPWALDKFLLRQSLAPWLPEQVCRRAKTPLQGDTLITHLEKTPDWPASLAWAGEQAQPWIDPTVWRRECERLSASQDPDRAWELMRVAAFGYWLRHSSKEQPHRSGVESNPPSPTPPSTAHDRPHPRHASRETR